MVETATDKNDEDASDKKVQVEIGAPIFVWLLLLVVSLAIVIFAQDGLIPKSGIGGSLMSIANLILFMPGALILPIIIGAAIGAEIGRSSKDMKVATKAGIINGVYAGIIYIIAIVIIYEIITYVLPSAMPSISFLLSYWLAMPFALVVLVSLGFAVLSHSRKVSVG
ncbi:MAG: hypothetical protein QXR16_03100 [Candidatus Micrarchaeaceae archaeon]